jgi:hypothetical protein
MPPIRSKGESDISAQVQIERPIVKGKFAEASKRAADCFKQLGLCSVELDPRVNPTRRFTGTELEVEGLMCRKGGTYHGSSQAAKVKFASALRLQSV